MALYTVEPHQSTLHGHFSRDLPSILTVTSGDTVRYRTLDASWHTWEQREPFEPLTKFIPRDRQRDPGHALCGPITIQHAKPGMTLEIRLHTIRTGTWGWSTAAFPSPWNRHFGIPEEGPEWSLQWSLSAETGRATNQFGQMVFMRPFMGVLGMPPDEAGHHSTSPPRFCGGNIDCKELVEGSRIYLPIAVEGGLFSVGDGHAVQGDGEVSGPALECPMAQVDIEFHLHPDLHLSMPRAHTPTGWITFGFDEDLDQATFQALNGMLDLMQELYGMARNEALALASLLVDLRITQIVNDARGVHAILPHGLLELHR